MKKQSQNTLIISFFVAMLIAGGIFWAYRWRGSVPASGGGALTTNPTVIDTQTFSGDGYTLAVPASWYVEQGGKDAVTAYPDHAHASSSSTPSCKIAMSVFPYAPSTSEASWIAAHIGADPSLAVAERSSEDIVVNGGSGVKWNGAIDGAQTTLVYAFSDDHAYEIAPSVINEMDAGNAQCADALETFISQLTIQ